MKGLPRIGMPDLIAFGAVIGMVAILVIGLYQKTGHPGYIPPGYHHSATTAARPH